MFPVPVTFCAPLADIAPALRCSVMREYASDGAKHIVFGCSLMDQCMRDYRLPAQLCREMEEAGLSFLDAHAPFGPAMDLFCPFPEFRSRMILRQKLAIALAAEVHAKMITIHVGNSNYDPEPLKTPHEEHIKRVKDSLSQLLPTAESYGITVCIENIWHATNTPEVLLDIKKDFPGDSLGFCYDAGHAHLMDDGRNHEGSPAFAAWSAVGIETPQWDDRILEKMLPHIVNCHLHDNDGTCDQHRNIGQGTIDWNHIIPLLKTAPRLQVIQSEVNPTDPHSSFRDVVEAFEKLGEIE